VVHEIRTQDAKRKNEDREIQVRAERLQSMNKWERFRLEREKVLKKYCALIKKSKIS
jgi:hypothetical protein